MIFVARPKSKLDNLSEKERSEIIHILFKRQNGVCYICGRQIDLKLDKVDIDHIIAISPPFNGVDEEQNWGLVHRAENESKSNKSLELTRHIFNYRKLRDEYVDKVGDFTVGDALERLIPKRPSIFVNLDSETAAISYIGQDETSRKEHFTLLNDNGVISFTGMIPLSWVYHDKSINPRSIADLEPMIEEFYNKRPQLQPSLAHIEINDNNKSPKIMLFDGQHKAAAQLFNGKEKLFTRVFVNTNVLLLTDTNFRAHTVLAQIHFPGIVQDKVGRDLFKQEFDEYLAKTEPLSGSEEQLISSLEDSSEYRAHLKRYLKYECLFNPSKNKILSYVETVW